MSSKNGYELALFVYDQGFDDIRVMWTKNRVVYQAIAQYWRDCHSWSLAHGRFRFTGTFGDLEWRSFDNDYVTVENTKWLAKG